jgi:SAM-dependent methyltransferase
MRLEHLFGQIAKSLRPGGFFFLDEYVGPNKFQWTDEQLTFINAQIVALPPRLKRSIVDQSLKGRVGRMPIEDIDAVDPSEAIRSADILNVLRLNFDIVEIKGCGGSLLHMLLEGIAGNFAQEDPEATGCLESMFRTEDALITAGKLQHDFAVIIARKKPTRAQRLVGRRIAYLVSGLRASLEGSRIAMAQSQIRRS